jgi:Uma2 family endonuclease
MATATLTEHESASPAAEAASIVGLGDDYEIVDGRVVEEPPLGAWEGYVATTIGYLLNGFVRPNRLGRVAGEVLFILRTEPLLQRKPDVAFVSAARSPLTHQFKRGAAWDVIPDLAVEVVSPSDTAAEVQAKVAEYFGVGVRLVWVVYPDQEEVYAYESPRVVRIFGREDAVDGGAVLPGFAMPLAEVFEVEVGTDGANAAGE